jgi:hypothetical protein
LLAGILIRTIHTAYIKWPTSAACLDIRNWTSRSSKASNPSASNSSAVGAFTRTVLSLSNGIGGGDVESKELEEEAKAVAYGRVEENVLALLVSKSVGDDDDDDIDV